MNRIHSIIQYFFNHNYPKDVQGQIQGWLIDFGNAKEKDEYLHKIWSDLNIEADDSTIRSLQQTKKKIRKQSDHYRQTIWLRIVKAAAVVVIPILSILASYFFIHNNDNTFQSEEIELTEYFAPNGEIQKIVLPDSSVVTLNSGSVLIYPKIFIGKTRNVYLNGQANFVVSKNAHQPFIVKTTYLDVKALGTVFDVSSYAQDNEVFATLESGRVMVDFKTKGKKPIEPMILTPNEQVTYHCLSEEVTRKQINQRYTSAWKQGSLVFQSVSMNDIATTFERRYDVTIYFNSNKYNNEIITVKFIHGETLEESLQILQRIITDFRYKIEGKKVFIN